MAAYYEELRWARLPESHRIVAEAWSRRDLGCPLIRVTSKLERVRKDLSRWYKHQVGDVALRINGLKQSLENIQIRCEAGDSSAAPVEMLLRQELSTALLEEESQWRQKARIKWLREGDGNKDFFQRVVKGRRVKNQILTMEDGGLEYEDQDMIQQICFNYFSSLLGTTDGSGEILPGLWDGEVVSEIENQSLFKPVTREEVKQLVFESDPDSAPGPDGFSASFFRSYWNIVSDDIFEPSIGMFNERAELELGSTLMLLDSNRAV
ncbi:Transposon TX1 uncharacterized protein [Nymphaea thermarum]|nr:Transposon TX1 uncharacterized protein [Nymphaea thermarum]